MAEKEYIERNALMKKIFQYGHIVDQQNYSINAKAIQKAIQDAPAADVVEVVRCKDCRFCERDPSSDRVKRCTNEQQWGEEYYPLVHDNDFCSYGERKTV